MATPKKKPSKAKHESDSTVWPLAEAFGLCEDGGWVDALKQEWGDSSLELRARWTDLMALCRDARPRGGLGWPEAEEEIISKCDPPFEGVGGRGNENVVGADGKPLFEERPDPGTDAYQGVLERAAPDQAWLEKVRALLNAAGATGFTSKLARICASAVNSGIGSLNRNSPNKEILRALIWCAAAAPDAKLLDALRQLAVWSFEHNTAQAKTIGAVLTFMTSEHAAATLRMIEMSAKKPGRKARFARYASHVEQRIGLSAEDSAERFVPTFSLDAGGSRKAVFGGEGAIELRIEGAKGVLRYFNATGKPVDAVPSAIKRNHVSELQEWRTAAKGLCQLLASQRARIESLFLAQTIWDLATWRERYVEHPVVGTLARRLVWTVDDSAALFVEGRAQDVQGNAASFPPSAKVRLWHPLAQSVNAVTAWRNRLESLGVTQPFKQAHREVYLLTDAERRTQTYSNRFAGHILRQHQFRALASTRGWEGPLLGGWDGGDQGRARRKLPGGWTIEFWIFAAGEDEPEAHFQFRGLALISTDQVRFYRGDIAGPARLEDVPPMIFSEAMRDVDLFVGVASVGNDPTWRDGGPQGRFRQYWQDYSFGELSTAARTRKEVLERMVPRLKIAPQCSLAEKFLVVKGRLRTYKIHLGSGNILMEPNDQYLCIVPDRKPDKNREKLDVFLPFEGDNLLSVIISKAFLLADDVKIKDPTIISQIKR